MTSYLKQRLGLGFFLLGLLAGGIIVMYVMKTMSDGLRFII